MAARVLFKPFFGDRMMRSLSLPLRLAAHPKWQNHWSGRIEFEPKHSSYARSVGKVRHYRIGTSEPRVDT